MVQIIFRLNRLARLTSVTDRRTYSLVANATPNYVAKKLTLQKLNTLTTIRKAAALYYVTKASIIHYNRLIFGHEVRHVLQECLSIRLFIIYAIAIAYSIGQYKTGLRLSVCQCVSVRLWALSQSRIS